jgi:hypothetical protein
MFKKILLSAAFATSAFLNAQLDLTIDLALINNGEIVRQETVNGVTDENNHAILNIGNDVFMELIGTIEDEKVTFECKLVQQLNSDEFVTIAEPVIETTLGSTATITLTDAEGNGLVCSITPSQIIAE